MGSELNQPKVFFPKLDALQFSELKVLREKMDARSKPDIDIRLEDGVGEPVHNKNFKIDDEIPIVENRKTVLYLQNVWNYRMAFNGAEPKYHVVHCEPLQKMRTRGNYENLFATRRTDGLFFVKLSDSNKLSLHKLSICQVCLKELRRQFGWNAFPKDPEKFPLADWLEPFFDYSSEDWKKRSQICREKANWICQGCGINLQSNSHFLHAHHEWGTKFDAPEDLIALCIGCHAEQPGGGHRMLKHYPDYEEFMRKYGEKWRSHHYPF